MLSREVWQNCKIINCSKYRRKTAFSFETMKEQAILHCIFLIFYATSSITEAICVEKVFIDSEQTVNVRVNENCLNFVQLESTEFLTQVSCANIEPYHENCHGRVLVLRANTDTTLVYCIVKPASLTTIVTKVFSALDSLEFYLEGEDLQHENVDCSVSTIKILPNPNGRSLSFDLFDEPEEEDPMVKPSFNVFSHLPSLFSSNDIFANPEPKLQCGQIQVIPDLNQRILGGKEATENNYNWMVLMVTQLPNGQRFMCGGNIISTTKVLTAAHCVQNAKSVRIYPGIHQLSHAKTYLKMKSFIVHEKYGFPNHDIAIVTIEKPFEFNDKVGPVCLPSHLNSNVEAKENMIGLGWGRTSKNA